MRVHPVRGAKVGALSALCFAVVTPLNNLIRSEPIAWGSVISGSVFAFFLFGVIGTFTDKIGSEVGDA